MPLLHLASRIMGTPLLIARSKLDVILAVLGPRLGLPVADAALPVGDSQHAEPRRCAAPPGIAVIPIHGTLVRRTQGLEAASGLTSYEAIGAQLDAALADPAIHGILLEVDSPGGEAGGVFELAERIRAADAVKPVWALAADSAFSAAYALAASASQLALTRTAGVGSIGVIALHVDQSLRDAQQGFRYTAITAGKYKNDFSPHAPLDPQAAERLQAEVDRLYGMFVTPRRRDARPRPECGARDRGRTLLRRGGTRRRARRCGREPRGTSSPISPPRCNRRAVRGTRSFAPVPVPPPRHRRTILMELPDPITHDRRAGARTDERRRYGACTRAGHRTDERHGRTCARAARLPRRRAAGSRGHCRALCAQRLSGTHGRVPVSRH